MFEIKVLQRTPKHILFCYKCEVILQLQGIVFRLGEHHYVAPVASRLHKPQGDTVADARKHTRRIADAALEGRCYDGSMIYERHGDGTYDNDKHWWVQAENVIGQYYLYRHHSMPQMLDVAYQSWEYIRDNIVDPEGEWHWSRRGTVINRDDDNAGFWKCPYHNSRMCLEILQ